MNFFLKCIVSFVAFFSICCLPAIAYNPDPIESEIEQSIGIEQLLNAIPSKAREYMEELGINDLSLQAIASISPHELFNLAMIIIDDNLQLPKYMILFSVGICVIAAIMGTFGIKIGSGEMSTLLETICVASTIGIIFHPIVECVQSVNTLLSDLNLFVTNFIPIYSTSMALSGHSFSAAAYSSIMMTGVALFSQLITVTIVPCIVIFLAIGTISASSSAIKTQSIENSLKSLISWTLGFVTTIFTTVLTIQTTVSKAADTVANKTVGFVLGSFIPVVGGAIGSAISSVSGYASVIKSTVGAIGLTGIVLIFLPILCKILLLSLSLKIANAAASFFDLGNLGKLFSASSTALGILLACVATFALFLIVGVATLLILI